MTSKNSCDTPAIGFQNNVITVTLNPYFFKLSIHLYSKSKDSDNCLENHGKDKLPQCSFNSRPCI